MVEFHSKFIAGIVQSICSSEDRADWRRDCYFRMLHWSRENPFLGTTKEKRDFSAAILRSIIRGVIVTKDLNWEEHLKFITEIKRLWFKVRIQWKLENGSTQDEDIAMMNNTRREDEGISD
jgi:hypothetical protein